MRVMPSGQDLVSNLRRLSVLAGIAGGALTAALGVKAPSVAGLRLSARTRATSPAIAGEESFYIFNDIKWLRDV